MSPCLFPSLLSSLLLLSDPLPSGAVVAVHEPAAPPATDVTRGVTDLLELVPLETASVWSWRSGEGTAAVEERFERVADAVLGAGFDRFVLDVMDVAGAPPELVQELRGIRNVIASVGNVVSWRELLGSEVVYAETELAHLLPGTELPGMLLACRPGIGAVDSIEGSLAGLLGAVAGTVGFLRYDIHDELASGARRYELVLRGDPDRALVQVAVAQDVILLGMGQAYFEQAVALLEHRGGSRLSESPRFQRAFAGLPVGTAGRSFVDVSLLVEDLDALNEVLAERSFNTGLWQGFLNGALDLAGTVDTIAVTTECHGAQVVTETLTRFDEGSPSWVRAGMSADSTAQLLEFVPANAVAFDMRGPVDLLGVFRWGVERWENDWAPAEDVLWVADVVQAVLGLSLEQDLLPWLGSEQVTLQVPTDSGTETVLLSRLTDEAGARKVLDRAEGIFHAMAPRLIARLQELLIEGQVPFSFDLQLNEGPREYPGLRRLDVAAFPMLMKQMVFGTIDGHFVFATSQAALDACLEVAAGRAPGLEKRAIAAGLLEQEGLCAASLEPMGAGIAQALELLRMASGFLEGSAESMKEGDREAQLAVHMALDLMQRVEGVLDELDFMGDAVTASEVREGGLARHEVTTLRLRLPEPVLLPRAPVAGATAPEEPIAETTAVVGSPPW